VWSSIPGTILWCLARSLPGMLSGQHDPWPRICCKRPLNDVN
jgi:hypothetical protein